MDISVIIVSWNVVDLLRDCLISLSRAALGGHTMETIVVDSASSDGTVEMVQREFPQVRLFAQAENVGFTRGNNIGLAEAQGRYLVLLNPDTEVAADAFTHMLTYLEQNPDVGIVGPHTLNTDGTTQASRWRFPNRRIAFMETAWLRPYAKSLLAHYAYADIPPHQTHRADWIQGSCMFARREVYAQIGGLDTGYVMYYEELDWCRRAHEAGWGLAYVAEAQIVHHGGKSTDQIGARKHIHYNESKLRYFRKVYGSVFATLLRVFLLAVYGYQLLLEWVKGRLGSQPDLRRERAAIYRQVLRSGLKVS